PFNPPSLRGYLPGHLLDLNDHELCGLERCEPHQDIDDSEIDIVLSRRLTVAFDEVRLCGRLALEIALPKEILHKGADVEPDRRPQRLIIRLEDHPLCSAIEALL